MSSSSALAVTLMRGPLIGTLIGLLLYGVTCMQIFFYFHNYQDDRPSLRRTVAVLWLLETVHAGMLMKTMDYYLVANYGDPSILSSATWDIAVIFIIGLLIDFIVYLYFSWRIWTFFKRRPVLVFMCAIAFARTGLSIVPCIWCVLAKSWFVYREETKTIILVGNILFIVGDTFSATVFIYYLRQSRIGIYRTDRLINRLLLYTMATGALTSLVDVAALIVTLLQPNGLAFMGVILVQTQLYANSLLTSLNVRHASARSFDGPASTNIELPSLSVQFARPRLSWTTEQSDHSGTTMMNNNLPQDHDRDDGQV
ncbi:hypothetical protein BV22DRAFT_268548 [Leucogyrophana mollusca]|uniref:Uncharacterized protein n=1 Tax=Leucogyrophana mollusca TaxID=85980 RepID=A0ACB8BQT7_9AGAM|nr:hypothetical protein BV22DRAFT_268548 [Leucogyrophana mollusca]